MSATKELSSHVLAHLEKSLKALQEGPYACTSLDLLTGGSANFTYRATLAKSLNTEDGEVHQTLIVKHAEAHLITNVAFKIDVNRVFYEQSMLAALNAVPPIRISGIQVTTPQLFLYDAETATQLMSDTPKSIDFKAYLIKYKATPDESQRFGTALGTWLAALHEWGAQPEQALLRQTMKNNKAMAAIKLNYFSGQLPSVVDKYPEELAGCRELFEAIHQRNCDEREDIKDGVLVHGDFWTGNVVLPDCRLPAAKEAETSLHAHPLSVIDFELSRLEPRVAGVAADLAQILAELYNFTHFDNEVFGRDIGASLLRAYKNAGGKIDTQLGFHVVRHWSIHHLALTTRIGWPVSCSPEQVRELVVFGRDSITAAWREDAAWFTDTYKGPASPVFLEIFS